MDDEEGDLLVSRDEEKNAKQKNIENKKKLQKEEQEQNILEIDDILDGGMGTSNVTDQSK
jgi:hypoxanthine-guanine phosphoribosyltransferase